MKFDKNRIYSAVNADELKPGDKVILADTLAELKRVVERADVVPLKKFLIIICIQTAHLVGWRN